MEYCHGPEFGTTKHWSAWFFFDFPSIYVGVSPCPLLAGVLILELRTTGKAKPAPDPPPIEFYLGFPSSGRNTRRDPSYLQNTNAMPPVRTPLRPISGMSRGGRELTPYERRVIIGS